MFRLISRAPAQAHARSGVISLTVLAMAVALVSLSTVSSHAAG